MLHPKVRFTNINQIKEMIEKNSNKIISRCLIKKRGCKMRNYKKHFDSIKFFNEEFFHGINKNIFWYDDKGIYHLSDRILVEINLEKYPELSNEAYSGYRVRMIDIQLGELSQHYFDFTRYFTERFHEPKLQSIGTIHYGRYFWFGENEPKEEQIKNMVTSIFEYINHFNK